MWVFYILYSKTKDKYYIGFTGDSIHERLRKHNSDHKGFTGSIGDWETRYTETHLEKNEAFQREQQVKKWKSRKMIEKLIQSEHPDV